MQRNGGNSVIAIRFIYFKKTTNAYYNKPLSNRNRKELWKSSSFQITRNDKFDKF